MSKATIQEAEIPNLKQLITDLKTMSLATPEAGTIPPGDYSGKYPFHLGDVDPDLERYWYWESNDFRLVAIDWGNGWYQIVWFERKGGPNES